MWLESQSLEWQEHSRWGEGNVLFHTLYFTFSPYFYLNKGEQIFPDVNRLILHPIYSLEAYIILLK